MNDFGVRLRDARKQANITQTKAAECLGVNRRTIASYETNEMYPQFPKIVQMAELYNVSIDYLAGQTAKHLTGNEQQIISLLREVPEEKQTQVIAAFQNMVDAIK